MNKIEILKKMTFGERIAEEERNTLGAYFVKTNQWDKLINGEIDIAYGAKGSGKSALYMNLLNSREELVKKNIYAVSAENPRGTTVFSELKTDPPASEEEFIFLWKLYFLSLCISEAKSHIKTKQVRQIYDSLAEYSLVSTTKDLKSVLNAIRRYASRLLKPEAIGTSLEFNSTNQSVSGMEFKVYFKEPTPDNLKKGQVSVDYLIKSLNSILKEKNMFIWILLDRLDVAFAESGELEKNAIKALFRVYQDLIAYENISLKIFLRDDIWKRVIDSGMRESSHITRKIDIEWDESKILNLIIQRVLSNEEVCIEYKLNKEKILSNYSQQEKLFYRLFPKQVESGPNKPSTLNWILNRTTDSAKKYSPREIIHLLNEAKEIQIKKVEIGKTQYENGELLERSALKEAITKVSYFKIFNTLLPEYPGMREYILRLEKQKSEHTYQTLSKIWGITIKEAEKKARELADLGFFEISGNRESTKLKVPFIYRYGIGIIQGKASIK